MKVEGQAMTSDRADWVTGGVAIALLIVTLFVIVPDLARAVEHMFMGLP